jgi:hypothetical protein
MNQTPFPRSVILAFAFSLLNAQQPLEPPLRNWAAPLHWAPACAHAHAPGSNLADAANTIHSPVEITSSTAKRSALPQ